MSNGNIEQTENDKQSRRPRLNFSEMGIRNGAELVCRHDGKEYKAIVVSDRKVLFDGEETSLSAATKKIKNIDYNLPPTKYWFYNGKWLNDIYCETYDESTSYIIANIAWNDNGWKKPSDNKTGFRWTQQEGNIANESWNFDFENSNNTMDHIYGYAQFQNPPQKAETNKFAIFFSSNKKIVGIYGNAEIEKVPIELGNDRISNLIGDRSLCIAFENMIDDTDKKFLFGKQRISQGGFNNITKDNALDILDEAIRLNPNQKIELNQIKRWIESTIASKNDDNTQGEPQMNNTLTSEVATLLTKTRNIILHGAPGTGKTHLAHEIAEAMGCSESEIGFVQFHPSYDYTDFVEGLRPVNNGDGQVGFERKDGVFKKFCERAILKNFKKSIPVTRIQDSSFNTVYKSLLDDVKSGKITSYTTSQSSYPLRLTEDGRLLYKEKSPRTESKENMRLMYDYFLNEGIYDLSNYDKDKYWDLISKLTNGRTSRIDYSEYGWTLQVLLDRAKKFEKEKQNDYEELEVQVLENENDNTPFVFIIDEINRGDMSKIFGELFFAIEPGYRGAEKCNSLRTQYANLQSEPNAFDEVLKITDSDNFGHFFIPENVYIIGTMNDIDRGVESMDFAFRRRFTFVEVKAGDRIEMLNELDDSIREKAKSRMSALNNAIWNEKTHSGIDGLSSAYHIGGAYFLKLKELDNDFDKLWEYHLAPLLKEYLRGMENENDKFDTLKKAYDNPQVSSEEE